MSTAPRLPSASPVILFARTLIETATHTYHVTSDFMVLLGPGLLSTEGVQHKKQRKLLNPVFSAAHLRNMSHIFYNVAHKVRLPV